jgi:hypothetical protein
MLTTIVATPRTGSTSLWESLESGWCPEWYPASEWGSEYYFFHNDRGKVVPLPVSLHKKLVDVVKTQPRTDIVLKIILGQLAYPQLRELLCHSDKIVHTVRRDFVAQLKSTIGIYYTHDAAPRTTDTMLEVTQSFVNNVSNYLKDSLGFHSKLYHKFGGEIVFLEDREYEDYGPKPTFNDDIVWPQFDTVALFTNIQENA